MPGPAAYGQGGARPTVSDANIVLGRLDREALLGGDLPIDAGAAETAIAREVATPLGLSVAAAAAKIVEIVNANMAEALRIVSVERGRDPRDFALIAFGGAGPVHAAFLADELGIGEVVVPPAPGAFSALGLVASDVKREYSRTLYADLGGVEPGRVAAAFAALEGDAEAMLEAARVPPERRALRRQADLRYRRQAYELTVPFSDGPVTRETLGMVDASFHDRHRQTYGHANPSENVQLVNLRLTALGRSPEFILRQRGGASRPMRQRSVWFADTGFADCPVQWRDGLAPGASLTGPAIVEALDSTIVVPPGWTARVNERGYIRMRRG
jgi:N-methylhydantoinase A